MSKLKNLLQQVNRRTQQGAIVVMFAMMMPIFIGFMALVFNLGQLYLAHNDEQSNADMIATAALRKLTWPDGEVVIVDSLPTSTNEYTTEQLENKFNTNTASLFNADFFEIAYAADYSTRSKAQIVKAIQEMEKVVDGIKGFSAEGKIFVDKSEGTSNGDVYYKLTLTKTVDAMFKDYGSTEISSTAIAKFVKKDGIADLIAMVPLAHKSNTGTTEPGDNKGSSGTIVNPGRDGGDTSDDPTYNPEKKSVDTVKEWYRAKDQKTFNTWKNSLTAEQTENWLEEFLPGYQVPNADTTWNILRDFVLEMFKGEVTSNDFKSGEQRPYTKDGKSVTVRSYHKAEFVHTDSKGKQYDVTIIIWNKASPKFPDLDTEVTMTPKQ